MLNQNFANSGIDRVSQISGNLAQDSNLIIRQAKPPTGYDIDIYYYITINMVYSSLCTKRRSICQSGIQSVFGWRPYW